MSGGHYAVTIMPRTLSGLACGDEEAPLPYPGSASQFEVLALSSSGAASLHAPGYQSPGRGSVRSYRRVSLNPARLAERFRNRYPHVTIVLDGWGIGHHDEGDATFQGRTPTLTRLLSSCPGSQILAHGTYVGLPSPKDIGGSEVGHLTMGAGQILPQGATRIKQLIDCGDFDRLPVLNQLVDRCLAKNSALHLVGLLSDGNVHSHISHFEAIIRHAEARGVKRVYVHALLDGRDVPYQSALDYVEPLEARFAAINAAHPGFDYAIASGGGREVITMDRDTNWEKVRLGWQVHVQGRAGEAFPSATAAVKALRQRMPDSADQDLPPFLVVRDGKPVGAMRDGDCAIFVNFRSDRAIEFSRAMVEDSFTAFDRAPRPDVLYAGMMTYDEDTNLPPLTLASAGGVKNPFGKRVLNWGLEQFRLAETQKYAHVTFFYNGGYRQPLDPAHEEYVLIPSDKVRSYAEAPTMKAAEIGKKARDLILSRRFHFGLINFANADMVGHTGDLGAAIRAVEAVDQALAGIVDAIGQAGGTLLITADHGNADEMIGFNPKTGKREPHTRHTLNPVPVVLFDPAFRPGDYALKAPNPDRPNTLSMLAATNAILLGRTPDSDLDDPLFDLNGSR
jgi:2,3-bisphosphoglycerate-independent phosphoglycerate mutase